MNTQELRQKFLDFFSSKQHAVVASSSLIPGNDPTLLFTNAGMVQFKDVFLGQDERAYTRATSSQRCVRAGGKHNDLENVGYTARHHTFFEMLGNFSFGDYFKRDAIHYAWEFLTQVLQLPAEKLWVTVFQDDKEAEHIWLDEMKIDPKRFSRLGEKSNFWAMGDTGPCGPCTEIFYDHGPEIAGGPPGSPDEDGDRYVEIWNLVFMQFNRDNSGKLTPLPKPSVDTGMGLERIAAVMQKVHSNYEIDLFQHLIKAIAKIINVKDLNSSSLKVIADHIRSSVFLIVDGVVPSNEGRGYVLRRIIRRAIRHGYKLGINTVFFYKAVTALVEAMGDAYPEIRKAQEFIEKTLLREEEQFARTLEQGMKILENDLANLKNKIIPGATIFKLYDTYGFPVDLTGDIARERELTLDMPGFEQEMAKQRSQSQEASQFVMGEMKLELVTGLAKTNFVGYESLVADSAILRVIHNEKTTDKLNQGQEGILILATSPFYAESGGQVGDKGTIKAAQGVFTVSDTHKLQDVYLHYGKVVSGSFSTKETVTAAVDVTQRSSTMANHSATHLLHAALRSVLGEHVTQKGSLVNESRLRFDFSHFEPMTNKQVQEIESMVNHQIRLNSSVETALMKPDQAKLDGAMALFGEKYGDSVRVLTMGKFSKELCGGTHVKRTGDIGLFKIVSEAGIAAGVRRLEAVTAEGALRWLDEKDQQLQQAAKLLKTNWNDVVTKLDQSLQQQRKLEKEIEQLRGKIASAQGDDLLSQAQVVDGIYVLAAKLEGDDVKILRDTLDQLKNKLKTAVIVLANGSAEKVNLIAGVTADATARIQANKIINELAPRVGGKGGGRPDMAQAGGNNAADLPDVLQSVQELVKGMLAVKI